MNCSACKQPNPDDAQFCGDCGVRLSEHTGDRAEIAELVNRPAAPTNVPTAPLAPSTSPPASPPPSSPPTSAVTQPVDAPTEAFTAHPAAHAAPPDQLLSTPQRRSSIFPVIVAVVAIGAVVLVGALLILADGSDDSLEGADPALVSTVAPLPTTDDTSAPATTVDDTTEAPVATAAPDTTPASTEPSPTAPTTAVPDPDEPAAIPSVPPGPGPVDAAGSPQVLANVLPSGVVYADVASSFSTAQALGDALALEDWNEARRLLPSLAGQSDANFVVGYGGTNRISLMLVDARREAATDQLLVVSVAVELDGAQTSLFCLRWDVATGPGTVVQVSGQRLDTWPGNVQPEAIRNDPAAMDTIAECTWA